MASVLRPFCRACTRTGSSVVAWFFVPVDSRVYACVRIAYAVLCLSILVDLWPERLVFLSREGVVAPFGSPWFSPLAYDNSAWAVTTFMVVAGVASLMLLFGLFTRFAACVLFVWNVAYTAALYPVMGGFDVVARQVGFAMMLSPPARAWSLDKRLLGARSSHEPAYALRLLQWQTLILYLATVWLKAPDPFWRNGELMAYFHLSVFARYPTIQAADFPVTSVMLTWSTLAIETVVPLLLWGKVTRLWGLALGGLLHLGIGLSSTLGLFSLAMLPLYASFLEEAELRALRLIPADKASG